MPDRLIDVGNYPVSDALDILLKDKSTKKNIIWATGTYSGLGAGFRDVDQIEPSNLLKYSDIIRPRIKKSQEAQTERTRKKAEVFTPAWLCNIMNNSLDEDWFGKKDVFNVRNKDDTWTPCDEKIEFPENKKWQNYVDSRRLEITCGEAPYLVSRYDVSTGEFIVPASRRIGIIDRKLRIVDENADNYDDWLKWTFRAFESSYGYEYQGDNVLIARINLLMTFCDYYKNRWGNLPDKKLIREISNKISWNIWQMDGLKDTVPLGKPYKEYEQLSFFDTLSPETDSGSKGEASPCVIYDWRNKSSIKFIEIKGMKAMGKKLFDYVIGNPPYQEESKGDKPASEQVYHYFVNSAYDVADHVELITPARFLFNAGGTPKDWNRKMLNDKHFKVLKYEIDSSAIFPTTSIKGGVCISYRDETKDFGAIGHFTAFHELNTILKKVQSKKETSIITIIFNQNKFNLDALFLDYPNLKNEISSNGKEKRLTSGCLSYNCFHDDEQDGDVKIIGLLESNKRVYKYINRKYIDFEKTNIYSWKVIVPANNGSGALGEVLSTPLIGEPLIGYTQTFISFGKFNSKMESEAALKYIKSKFCRVMLGVLKVTQNGKRETWSCVPLQDFTSDSDIDWSKSIHEIDLQLYKKYGLDENEINFIETHVKEME